MHQAIEQKIVVFQTPYLYIDFMIVNFDSDILPYMMIVHTEADTSLFCGECFNFNTEKEAEAKAEEMWYEIKNSLMSYLNEN